MPVSSSCTQIAVHEAGWKPAPSGMGHWHPPALGDLQPQQELDLTQPCWDKHSSPLSKPLLFLHPWKYFKAGFTSPFHIAVLSLLSGAKMCGDIQHLWSPNVAGSRTRRKIRLECAGGNQSSLLLWQERAGCDSSAYGSYINPTHSPLRFAESCSDQFKSWQFITRVVTAFLCSNVRNLSFVAPRNTNVLIFPLESLSHQGSPKEVCALEIIRFPWYFLLFSQIT